MLAPSSLAALLPQQLIRRDSATFLMLLGYRVGVTVWLWQGRLTVSVSLSLQGRRRQYGEPGRPSPVALEMYEALTSLQQERSDDAFGWVVPVCEC